MADDKTVLEEIQREVKGFGDTATGLKAMCDSQNRDLEAVRKLAEEAKGMADHPEIKAQLDALAISVVEKQVALETSVKANQDQADRLEAAFKRLPTGDSKNAADETKDALAFWETKASASGNGKWGSRPTVETMDKEGYDLWAKSFDTYLRSPDERAIEAKALSVGSNPDGGYLVPTAQSARIINKIFESSPLRQLATVEIIGTEALEVPVDIGEAGAGWVGEEQTRSETDTPQVGVQRIPVHELYANPKVTQKFLEDAAINVEAWLSGKIADKFGRTEATAFVSGTGINQPRGILTYAAGSTRGTIAQVASGAATALTDTVIAKMPFRIKSLYLANASWLMKRSTVEAVVLMKDGNGQFIWRPGLTAGSPSTLVGHSVYMADDMPAVGAGTLSVAFGDFRRAYTVVDRLGITTLRDPYSAKPFVSFYSRKRVGGDVVDFDAFALVVVSA
jgi:HK97 family phage major capsid protein